MLRAAVSGPFPPDKITNPPLHFNLEVVESAPNPDQMRTITSYLSPKQALKPSTTFVVPSALEEQKAEVHSAEDVAMLGRQDPSAVRWPIVVDWAGGYATVGDLSGVQALLELMRQKRDGEIKEDVNQPKGWFS